jgi:transglutaminase-like putative cysteine protease
MKFNVSCELDYNLNEPATFLFSVKCLRTRGQQIIRESFVTSPAVHVEDLQVVGAESRFSRLKTYNPGAIGIHYKAEVDVSVRLDDVSKLSPDHIGVLDTEGVPFLFPSRYCQSDRMRQQANAMFGHLEGAYAIASAVSDWIHDNIAYVSGSSGETCSAVDIIERRQGVCRDFAHLGIAMCRALSVPARYVSAYAYQMNPPDFHACFEVRIGGSWYVFDPTRLVPLNGLVRIATGRDAADVAVCTMFGDPWLTKNIIDCQPIAPLFNPITHDSLIAGNHAITLL